MVQMKLKTKFIIKDIKHFSWGPYPQAGIFHPIYLTIFIGIIIHTVLTLFYSLKDPRRYSSKSVQEKHILLLGFMLFSLGSLDFIPNYGISMRPLGFIPATIFIFIFAYAIIKHHILDINLFIKKGIIYSFLIVFITFLYFALILIAEKILQGIVGYRSFSISVLTAFTLGILFIPLRNKIQYFVDRIFYRGSQEEIARENELLRQELAQTEKLKAVAALASGMSHEIKNPLTAIKTFTEYLPEKKDDKEFLDKFAKIVGKEVDRIDDIVHQLLEFAKPSPFSFKETNIHKLLDETIDFLNSKLIKNKIKILKKYSENSAPLEADPGKLKQAFLNILLNAIEAMPIGGILEIHTESNSDKLTISIVDIGPGISKKDLKNIFDPFYTKKDGGTGLGLSITQRIISEHNGRIWAESKTGQGAKFVIELPL